MGLVKRSASGSEEGAFSMRSESGVIDIVVVRMMMGVWMVMFRMALGVTLLQERSPDVG